MLTNSRSPHHKGPQNCRLWGGSDLGSRLDGRSIKHEIPPHVP